VVDKAYDKLTETLGDNWQKEYIVWDMCCGVGNLEVKHSNPRNIYMSTLDQADVDVMKATNTCVSATRFQYDYLNDDITDDGKIDYSLTNKVPEGLRKAIAEGKKILVLINPPYAEAGKGVDNRKGKKDVSKTKIERTMDGYGHAARELFVQFLVRIKTEIPTATIAIFSTLKYINASNFDKFRENWSAEYLGGFIAHSKAFDGIKGDFPIGFLIWKTNHNLKNKIVITKVSCDVLNKDAVPIGERNFYNISDDKFLNTWIKRPKSNKTDALPLKNAIRPATSTYDVRGDKWADGAIGGALFSNNDLQHSSTLTAILSSGFCSPGGFLIIPDILWQVAIVFSMRRIVKPTWFNDRDQFLQPTELLTDEFKNDCLVWMLFNGSNLTASANDLEWNGKKWSIVNHFIPFTEEEVGSPERFESDFMIKYIGGKVFSSEAKAVLEEGKKLWQAYYKEVDTRDVRDELKLNRADVGWYQIRNAIKKRNESGDFAPISFKQFEESYKTLTEKLQPKVYELGFLKN
jgi:hypothetical protein